MMTRGNKLRPDVQRQALATFVHRMTRENVERFPDFARGMVARGYRMPIISDAEWLKRTLFHTRKDGNLDARYRYCQTES